MPARPATPRTPLDLGQARVEFDTLLRDRVRAMLAAGAGREAVERGDTSDEAALLDASARAFVEQVDRYNGDVQAIAGSPRQPLAYDDAVVITGDGGVVIVSVDEYDRERVYHEARAGAGTAVTTGPELLAYLRTGEPQAARGLGLT